MSAIDAGKHLYCESPLGRNTAERWAGYRPTPGRMVPRRPARQMSTAINYVKDLIADGLCRAGINHDDNRLRAAPNWGAAIDRAYQADRANDANLMTITGRQSHRAGSLTVLRFRELTSFSVGQPDRIPLEATGELVAKD